VTAEVDPSVLVNYNPFVRQEEALNLRAFAGAQADAPPGIDHPLPGNLLRTLGHGVADPARLDVLVASQIDSRGRRD